MEHFKVIHNRRAKDSHSCYECQRWFAQRSNLSKHFLHTCKSYMNEVTDSVASPTIHFENDNLNNNESINENFESEFLFPNYFNSDEDFGNDENFSNENFSNDEPIKKNLQKTIKSLIFSFSSNLHSSPGVPFKFIQLVFDEVLHLLSNVNSILFYEILKLLENFFKLEPGCEIIRKLRCILKYHECFQILSLSTYE